MSVLRIALLSLALTTALAVRAAPTAYVSDRLSAQVRSGKSTGHKILELVPSGTPLQVLRPDQDGYTQVRTPRGRDGWILSRLLMDQPSARSRMENLKRRLSQLETDNARLKEDLRSLNATKRELDARSHELTRIKKTAARSLTIEKENRRLKRDLDSKQQEVDALTQENGVLKDESRRDWFITGASVALGSLFFGLIIPRLRWQKKRRWDQF